MMEKGSKPDWQELNPECYKLLTGAEKILTFDEKFFARIIVKHRLCYRTIE